MPINSAWGIVFRSESSVNTFRNLFSFAKELTAAAIMPHTPRMEIKEKIEKLLSAGHTQQSIAAAAGIGQGTVSKLLNGGPDRCTRLETYRKIMAMRCRKPRD